MADSIVHQAEDTFRVGIVGAGDIAESVHVPVLAQMPCVQVRWLCDLDRARAARLAGSWGIPSAFDRLDSCPQVDAVLLAIPVGLRRDVLAVAFERRWHALVEKPFAATVDDHLSIMGAAARAGVEVGVGLTRRFFRSTEIAQRVLHAGIGGPVQEVWASEAARMGATGREGAWYQADPSAAGGGALMETGVHVVDQVLQILGATGFHDLRAAFEKVDGIDLEARITATLSRAGSPNGIPLRLLISRKRDRHSAIVIRCRHATFRVGLTADSGVELLGADDRAICSLERATGATSLYRAFRDEWEAFKQQCRSRVTTPVDAASALLTTRLIEAAYRHAAGAAA